MKKKLFTYLLFLCAIVCHGQNHTEDSIIKTTLDSIIAVKKDSKWAFFSVNNKQLTNFVYDEISAVSAKRRGASTFCKNGLIRVVKNKKLGYLDCNLKEVIPFGLYDTGERFQDNRMAIVSKSHVFGIVNEWGREAVKISYDTIYHSDQWREDSGYICRKDSLYQFLDESLKPITPLDIKEITLDNIQDNSISERIYVLKNTSGKVGAIYENGEILFPFIYKEIRRFEDKEATIVKTEKGFGLLSRENKLLLDFWANDIWSYMHLKHFVVKKGDKYGVVDSQGNQLLDYQYEDLEDCYYDHNDKRYIVKEKGKYGIIDLEGNVILPLQYDKISNWVEGGPKAHLVTLAGKKGIISREGKIIVPAVYDTLQYYNDEIIIVKKQNQYGITTINGDFIIPLHYDEILVNWFEFTHVEKPLEIYAKKNGKYFLLNKKNKVIRNNIPESYIIEKFKTY